MFAVLSAPVGPLPGIPSETPIFFHQAHMAAGKPANVSAFIRIKMVITESALIRISHFGIYQALADHRL